MAEIKHVCVCGSGFTLTHDSVTTEVLMEKMNNWIEAHEKTCRHWEISMRRQNFEEAFANKQLAIHEGLPSLDPTLPPENVSDN